MFKVGEKVKFTKEWLNKITPNCGVVSKKKSKDPNFVWVEFDVPNPPANVLLCPIDKLEHSR